MPDAPVDRARRALAILRVSNDPDVAWLAAGLADYLSRAPDVRLDEALGLHPIGWGEHGWWTHEARAARNAPIAELDCQCFGQLPPAMAARGMLQLARDHRARRPNMAVNQAHSLARINGIGCSLPAQRQFPTLIATLRAEAGREIRGCSNFLTRMS